MSALERLRQAIAVQENALRAAVPADRPAALTALVRSLDRLPEADQPEFDLVTGRRLADLVANTALRLCLEAGGGREAVDATAGIVRLEPWEARFLRDCAALEAAQLVMLHGETGFMRLVDDGQGHFAAWIATKLAPASWRERADLAWRSWLVERHAIELEAVRANLERSSLTSSNLDAVYLRFADIHLSIMAGQIGFPPDAVIGGCSYRTYRAVLRQLIAMACAARNRDEEPEPQSEASLIAALASRLTIDPAMIATALAALTLDECNAAYHATTPDVIAPLVRPAPDRLICSVRGLTTRPFFFLHRELRRRAASEYHNTTVLREDLFRQDLHALFTDKRFVTSPGRIALRRDRGDLRTDIDAVVFDRKTGALGLFELKWQDPFARSTAELTRQGETMLHANRQVAGILDWINRHGADEILGRVDPKTAKTFRVRKVFPFVLGRYLMPFPPGMVPDRRIAWGAWPQVLRLVEGQSFGSGTNPLASLFARLARTEGEVRFPGEASAREIDLGPASLIVHPSFAAFQAASGTRR